MLAIIAGVSLAIGSQAHAAPPPGNTGEHVPAGMGMGAAGGGYAAQNRPTNDTESHAMKELRCPCGCARESILECDCATAAKLRAKVQAIMADAKLDSADSREQAYNQVLAAFKADYGEDVLATPRSNASWLAPSIVVVAGLGVLGIFGRRWIKSGQRHAAATPAAAAAGGTADDDKYADKLDDELAETDD
jgi:cytochrome c-type biogenesis protein CcmH/NrfF